MTLFKNSKRAKASIKTHQSFYYLNTMDIICQISCHPDIFIYVSFEQYKQYTQNQSIGEKTIRFNGKISSVQKEY